MIRINNVKLPLGYTDEDILKACSRELRIPAKQITKASLYRLSIDARHKDDIRYITSVDLYISGSEQAVLSKA